jgi:hypothetical protein
MVRTSPRLAKDVDITEESELRRLESGTAETFHDETIVQAGGGGGACDGDEADAVVEAGARTSVSEVGALGGSRVGQKEFLPTALLKQHLPAGMGSMTSVPRLMDIEAENDVARLAEYVATIRRTARVFEVCNCKEQTLMEHDSYIVWLNSWACLSGFGNFLVVNEEVCTEMHESGRVLGLVRRTHCVLIAAGTLCQMGAAGEAPGAACG